MIRTHRRCVAAGILLMALTVLSLPHEDANARANGGQALSTLSTNEEFIAALEQRTDLNNPKQIFEFVMEKLSPEVMVYPTENYYYFEFRAEGRTIKGNIGLFADIRDRGELSFAYEEEVANPELKEPLFVETSFSAKDGISIRKLADFRYTVTFQNKTVTFNLNKIEQKVPDRIHLEPDEIFVGHSFDESGLKFFLIFNREFNHLFWVLDDQAPISETLTNVSERVFIGNRTGFAFYDDHENHRKILIGVSKKAVKQNSWYDGPFDQLPDNYVANGQVELQKYLEAAYPSTRGKIDKFGISLLDRESRIAITSYVEYDSSAELTRVIDRAMKTSRIGSRFYCEITGMRNTEVPRESRIANDRDESQARSSQR